MTSTVRVYVWRWKMKLGKFNIPLLATSHASIEIINRTNDGTESSYDYLSFWPEGFLLKPGWQDGAFNPGYGPERENLSVPHRYSDSVFLHYHRKHEKPRLQTPQQVAAADWIFEAVSPTDACVSAMRAYVAALKCNTSGKLQYHILLNNCSTLIAQTLSLGGFMGNHIPCRRYLLWTPNKIKSLCLCLSRSGTFRILAGHKHIARMTRE